MIVRDLTDDVVQNVRVGNVVEGDVEQAIAAVHCGQSAPQPVPLQQGQAMLSARPSPHS
jgi:hypothetical protein